MPKPIFNTNNVYPFTLTLSDLVQIPLIRTSYTSFDTYTLVFTTQIVPSHFSTLLVQKSTSHLVCVFLNSFLFNNDVTMVLQISL